MFYSINLLPGKRAEIFHIIVGKIAKFQLDFYQSVNLFN